jgi:hypothetical protein
MDTAANSIQNNALARLTSCAPGHVVNCIKKAAAKTGVNFAYLMQQAGVESDFNPAAKAKTSSATGLYQFLDKTWMQMVKKYGDKYGMGDLASQIDAKGRVDDKALKNQILALRNDPEKSAALAAEFANENKSFLDKSWGGDVGSTELYIAHFMGAGGAAAFLKARDDNPLQQAALIFPKAAAANRNVFYDTKTGRAKTMEEVYAFFDKKFEIKTDEAPASNNNVQMASAVPAIPAIDISTINTASADIDQVNAIAKDEIISRVFASGHNTNPSGGSFFKNFYASLPSAHQMMANPLDLIMLSQTDLSTDKRQKSFN